MKKQPTLFISIKDPKVKEIVSLITPLDWEMSGSKIIIKGDGSKEHTNLIVKIMELASDYELK